MDSSRSAKLSRLQYSLDLNRRELGKLHDSDDPIEQRKIVLMRDSLIKLNATIEAEIRWEEWLGSLVVASIVFGVIAWFVGSIFVYHYFGGQAFAGVFWSGVGVMVVGGISRWIYNLLNPPKRW